MSWRQRIIIFENRLDDYFPIYIIYHPFFVVPTEKEPSKPNPTQGKLPNREDWYHSLPRGKPASYFIR